MRIVPVVAVVILALAPAARVSADEAPVAVNPATLHFSTPPGMPPCMKAAAVKGDPEKGPAVLLAKGTAWCRVPWHWHTGGEQLMVVSGTGTVEMKDGKPFRMQSGAYTSFPGHHVHQATCVSPCTMFVVSDAAFDIHYVDDGGKEIPPGQALKAGAKRGRH